MLNNEVKAKHTEKMIKISIRFWTNDIAQKEGHIVQKNCHSSGCVTVPKNKTHGIESGIEAKFATLEGIPMAIHAVMKEAGLIVHM